MTVNDNIRGAVKVLLESDFSDMRSYDSALKAVESAVHSEHRRIAMNESGTRYNFVFSELCRNFVVDNYFGGLMPYRNEKDKRKLVRSLHSALTAYLYKEFGIQNGSVMYKDEVDEMRIRLMDTEKVSKAIESSLTKRMRELLEEYRRPK